jgi:hypothetical protein
MSERPVASDTMMTGGMASPMAACKGRHEPIALPPLFRVEAIKPTGNLFRL